MLALATLGGVVAYATGTAGRILPVAAACGSAAFLALVAALAFRRPALVPWSLAAAAAGYLATREGRQVVDGWAAVVGAALLLVAELAFWSATEDGRIQVERELVLRRAATIAVLVAVSLLVGFLLLGAAAVSASAGIFIATAGVAAAVCAVGLVLRLARAA